MLLLLLLLLSVALWNALADVVAEGANVRPLTEDLNPAARFETHWLTVAGTRLPWNEKLIDDD